MEKKTLQLLEMLFLKSISGKNGLEAKKFRADNYKNIGLLDELESKQYIEIRDENYYVKLAPLLELSNVNQKAEHILFLTELIFEELHSFYLEKPGGSIKLDELATRADIPRTDVNKGLSYIVQSHIMDGYTTKFCEDNEATVTPGERVLKFNTFNEVIEDIVSMQSSSLERVGVSSFSVKPSNPFESHDFINQERITTLDSLISKNFDFKRLITICNEINSCAKNENYLALAMLIRSLLDHIPPIFEENSFRAMTSNCAIGKSVKKSFENLESSSRHISDGILHQMIRKKETIPVSNQVNFSPDIDVLIAEIIRKVEEDNM